jgi:hypothetical protein
MRKGGLSDVVLVVDGFLITTPSGKKAALASEGAKWEWVTRPEKDATNPVAPSSVQIEILQDGFAGMKTGAICDVVFVNADFPIIKSGQKAALRSQGTVWEWVQSPAGGAA